MISALREEILRKHYENIRRRNTMDLTQLSKKYKCRRLNDTDIDAIYALCVRNSLYYEYCPPDVTKESIAKDMLALPPNVDPGQKYYMGFFAEDRLVAVLDLIDDYPQQDIAYIGFFMVDVAFQHSGIGSEIISTVSEYLCSNGYSSIRLAWVKGNPQAEHFWKKNGFMPIKETSASVADVVILAERIL